MFSPLTILKHFIWQRRQNGNTCNGLYLAYKLSIETENKWGSFFVCAWKHHRTLVLCLWAHWLRVNSGTAQGPGKDGKVWYAFWMGRTAMTQYVLLRGRANRVTLLGFWDVDSLSSCLRVGSENLQTQMYCQVSGHVHRRWAYCTDD